MILIFSRVFCGVVCRENRNPKSAPYEARWYAHVCVSSSAMRAFFSLRSSCCADVTHDVTNDVTHTHLRLELGHARLLLLEVGTRDEHLLSKHHRRLLARLGAAVLVAHVKHKQAAVVRHAEEHCVVKGDAHARDRPRVRLRGGGREGIYRSSLDAREPQNPTESEGHQRHLQGVWYIV